MTASPIERMRAFEPKHDALACIDSDGCAFDTMGIKQRECFCPWMIEAFGLQPVAERGFQVPSFPAYFAWVEDPESLLSNDGLRRAAEAASGEARRELEAVLAWSERVNWAVGEIVKGIPPFPGVREVLERLQGKADVVVVSATPLEALDREWEEHGLASLVDLICGQEMGTKSEQIASVGATYGRDRVLMIGDAPGDLRAADDNRVLFYPVIPGDEAASWATLEAEGLKRFFDGTYAGAYEASARARFDRALPECPPWEVDS